MSRHHLAQINVARLRAPIDAPETADFVAALAPVNADADAAPGFVWRLQTESGDATGVQVSDDPLLIVNLTVWESVEALEAFAYRQAAHLAVLRRRREWFERHIEAPTALWWVAAGHIPTLDEALDRLATLRAREARHRRHSRFASASPGCNHSSFDAGSCQGCNVSGRLAPTVEGEYRGGVRELGYRRPARTGPRT